jgi:hypothetical protein
MVVTSVVSWLVICFTWGARVVLLHLVVLVLWWFFNFAAPTYPFNINVQFTNENIPPREANPLE